MCISWEFYKRRDGADVRKCSVVRTEVGYKTTDAAGAQFSRACVCVRMCPCTCEWGVATVLGMEVLCG